MSDRAVIAILADDHAGSPFGLFPGAGWELDDGNHLEPNGWQTTLYDHWCNCARRVADLRKGGRLILVHAGDATEGVHHGTPQLLTCHIDEQERLHVAAMREFMALARWRRRTDKVIYLAGTEAHAGPGNASTERILRTLLDTDTLDGGAVRGRLYAAVEGVLFDVAHQGYRLGARAWTRTNSMRAYLESRWVDALRAGKPMPRFVVRAHRHTYGYAELCDDYGATVSEAYLMPCWKLKDDFVYKVAPEAVSSIGMLIFVAEHGQAACYPQLMTVQQDEVEVL